MPHPMAEAVDETQESLEYEGPYDGQLPNDMEMECDMSLPSNNSSKQLNLRPTKKRSCSPAKKAAPPPITIPRLVEERISVRLKTKYNSVQATKFG